MSTMDREEMRKAFEDAVFNRRFRASITRNPNPPKGFGGLDFISTGCPTQAELCKRDESDDYVDEVVSAMWWGWQAAMAHSCADKAELVEALQEIAVHGTAWTHEGLVMIARDALSRHGG